MSSSKNSIYAVGTKVKIASECFLDYGRMFGCRGVVVSKSMPKFGEQTYMIQVDSDTVRVMGSDLVQLG